MASNEHETNTGTPIELELIQDESAETPLAEQAAASVAELAQLAVTNTRAALRGVRRTVTHPASGAAFAGATVLALSSVFGLTPTVVGAGAVYFAHRAIRRKRARE
jgi:hypothetical protein